MVKRRNSRPRRAGFTLVEMLVVVGILVLLASLVVPRVLGSRKKADEGAAKFQISTFKNSLEQYAIDCKTFPMTEEGLDALVNPPLEATGGGKWGGPYLTSGIPADPWGNAYQYEYPPARGSGDSPDIWSLGPDGVDDTEDDICSWTGDAASGSGGGEMTMESMTAEPGSGKGGGMGNGTGGGTGGGSGKSSTPKAIKNPAPVSIGE
jgi:general secretion pathway protein G